MKKYIFTFLWIFFVFSCGNNVTNTDSIPKINVESNRDIFEKHFEKNVDACVTVMVASGYEAKVAKEVCSCALKTAYEIDSNFILMKEKERNEFFIKNNIYKFCDSARLNKDIIIK